jgi:streptogramin lyase
LVGAIALLVLVLPVNADQFPDHGQLSGTVTGSQPGVLPVVYAYNTDRDVGYMVFVVDGKYRAVNLMPAPYDVTIRPAIDQLEGFTPETVQLDVAADEHVTADFALKNVGPVPNYVGGYPYDACSREVPDCPAKIVPYEELFPPGPGREILERYCFGCHQESIISYNHVRTYPAGHRPFDKAGWTATVDRMNARYAHAGLGKDPKTDPALLPRKDRDIVIDYLTENFGPDSEPRVLQLSSEAELDLDVLEKAQYVEYIYNEDPEKYPVWPWSHNVAFGPDGNVWIAYRNCCIVRFDPRTGEQKAFEGNGGGSAIIVDHQDGTVWYSGGGTPQSIAPGVPPRAFIRHLDPATGLVDTWVGAGHSGYIFDSEGNLWMTSGGLSKWDRQEHTIMSWRIPVIRGFYYGITVDSQDKLWGPNDNSGGVIRFDPETETFKWFQLTEEQPARVRRPAVDSNDMIWVGDWASPNRRQANGRNKGGTLYRLNPETGEVTGRGLGIEYSTPYDTDVDADDNVWVANDNFISKYDQKADTFTHYPAVRRSDTLKLNITRDGAIWFVNRNDSKFTATGGAAMALYPDKDKIKTFAAYYAEGSDHYRYYDHRGPMPPKVTGSLKHAIHVQNEEEYEEWAIDNKLPDSGYTD